MPTSPAGSFPSTVPGVADPHADRGAARERQLVAHELDQRRLELDHLLAGTRPGRLDVARQGQRAGAQVHRGERLARHPQQVDDRAHAGDVLEMQVRRIVEVDVRLRGAVDVELPPAGEAGAHHAGDGAVGQPRR